MRVAEFFCLDGEIFACAVIEVFPRFEAQALGGAGAVLGGDVLADGVLVGVDDIEGLVLAGPCEVFGNGIAEDIAVVPAAFGWLGLKLDHFHATAGHRGFVD